MGKRYTKNICRIFIKHNHVDLKEINQYVKIYMNSHTHDSIVYNDQDMEAT